MRVNFQFWEGSRRLDADGRTKAALDCMSGLVYLDDRQVQEYCVKKFVDKKNPRVEIVVEPLSA